MLRVIDSALLRPQGRSLVDWALSFYAGVAEAARTPSLTDSLVHVYGCLVHALLAGSEDASVADALATILPTFLQQPSPEVTKELPGILKQLVAVSPAVFDRWLAPHFVETLTEVQKRDLEEQVALLHGFYEDNRKQVLGVLETTVTTVLTTNVHTDVADCMLFRHVIALLNQLMRRFP